MPAHNPGWHVFEEDQGGSTLADDPGEMPQWCFGPDARVASHDRPSPLADDSLGALGIAPIGSFIGVAPPLPGEAVRLAWRRGCEDVNPSSKRPSIESGKIIAPDRCLTQARRFHPRQEKGRRAGVPLNVTENSMGVPAPAELATDRNVEHPGPAEE